MKKTLVAGVALAGVLASLASPAFAAPPKHHSAIDRDSMAPYSQTTNQEFLAPRSDVVTFGGRVVGQDPDANIRGQLRHDPVPSEY